tara:strand:- start:797 stop:961 length:165 start_codon:yes stop_codon:yes gene_type:complete
MNVGDLVRHKRFGSTYIIAKPKKGNLIGIWSDDEIRWIAVNWIEVISCARAREI